MNLAFIKKRFSFHGGAERYLQTLVEALQRSGHGTHIFSSLWSDVVGVTFHRVPVITAGSFLSTYTFNHRVCREIRRHREFDCVVSFERTTCQDVYRAGEGCHAEWLTIRRHVEPFHKRLSFRINPLHILLLSLERRLFSGTKRIVANSGMVKEQIMGHYGVPAERISTVYNGVDLSRFTPENRKRWRNSIRADLAVPEQAKVVLFAGSGFERKGLDVLLRAVPHVGVGGLKVIVAGKGESRRYSAFIRRAGLSDDVLFLGPCSGIERLYAASDIFVLPTLYDPFSNATIEAMAAGLPVITTRNNGAAELVSDAVEGYVVDAHCDPVMLAGRIRQTLDQRERMGEEARSKAEQYPIERAAAEFLAVIEKTAS